MYVPGHQNEWNAGFNDYNLEKIDGKGKQSPQPPAPPPIPPVNPNAGFFEKVKAGVTKVAQLILPPIVKGLAESGKIYAAVAFIALTLLILLGLSFLSIGACSLTFAVVGMPLIGFGCLVIPVGILLLMATVTGI